MLQLIKFENVCKEYKNGVKAVNNINMHINPGEFVFLIGHSGAGKSTITKLILKETRPTGGRIYLNGEDITNVPNRKIPYIRRYIGIVFQDFRLLSNKTVYENVAFAMQIIGAKPKDIRRNIPIILSMVGLSDKANSFPHQLSGGECQRTAIARAIINKPQVIIADEPTGNLDDENAWEIMNLLQDINNRGTTIIMATHAKEIVDRMKKRVVTLNKGEIVSDLYEGGYYCEI